MLKTILSAIIISVIASANIEAETDATLLPDAKTIATRVLAERPAPLTDITIEKTFNVVDFGAIPNDHKDDLPAVRKALAAAKESGVSATVIFPKGRYELQLPENEKRDCIDLRDITNLIIDGKGSEIILTHPRSAFLRITNGRNIIIQNLTVDYDPLPFTQGIVRAVHPDKGQFDVEIAAGFLPADAPHLQAPNTGFLKDKDNPLSIKTLAENYHRNKAIEKLENGQFRFTLLKQSEIRNFAPGDKYVSQGRLNAPVVFAVSSHQVTCRNITIYASAGANYVAARTDALNIINCQTRAKPGRWHSTNADGVHVQSVRIGPWVENCIFEGMADDGVNVYTLPFRPGPANPNGWLKNGQFIPYVIEKGDPLVIFHSKRGSITGPYTVTEFDVPDRRLRLDPTPTEQDLQDKSQHGDLLYNEALCGKGTVIRNNKFINFRGRGILLKAHDAVIEGNLFEHVSNEAITLRNNSDVPEGFMNRNVAIISNVIRNCGTDANFTRPAGTAAISVVMESQGGKPPETQGHQRIAIENNTIEEWTRTAIAISGGKYLSIEKNKIINSSDRRSSTDHDLPIRVSNASEVSVSDNEVRDTRSIKDKIEVGTDCKNVQINQ